MFEKLVDAGGFDWGDDIVPIHHRTFDKTAAQCHTPDSLLRVIEGLKEDKSGVYVLLNALGASEVWGCFPAGTKVLMGDGTERPIERVRPGERVMSHAWEPRRVENVQIYENKIARKTLRVEGLAEKIETTPEHPFWVWRGDGLCQHDRYKRCLPPTQGLQNICQRPQAEKSGCHQATLSFDPEWVMAGDLRPGDFMVVELPEETGGYLGTGDGVAEARFLGLWFAEGNFLKYGKTASAKNHVGESFGLEFTFNIGETDYVNDVTSYAESRGWKWAVYPKESDNSVSVRVYAGRRYVDFVRKTFGEYAAGKRVDPAVLRTAREWRLAFLGGVLDGDGCFKGDGTSAITRLAADQGTRDLQRLVWGLGAPCSRIEVRSNGYRHYQLRIPLSQLLDLETYAKSWRFDGLEQTTKVRSFYHDGRMYLPLRDVEDSESASVVFNLEVEEDHTYFAGGVTVHNCNRNGDAFPAWSLLGKQAPPDIAALLQTKAARPELRSAPSHRWGHETFVTNAHPFIHHQNKDPRKATGKVIASAYNDVMHRVELIVFLDGSKDPEGVRMVRDGRPVPFSMGCRVPSDVCAVCFNVAKNRTEYCDHAGSMMNQILPGGRKVFVYNFFPLFFDISRVGRPADPSAWLLRKVASAGLVVPPFTVDLELAKAAKQKAAAMAKNIPADNSGSEQVDGESLSPDVLRVLMDRIRTSDRAEHDLLADPQLEAGLRVHGLGPALCAASVAGIILRPSELSRAMEITGQSLPETLDLQKTPSRLLSIVRAHMPGRSLFAAHLVKRLSKTAAPSEPKTGSYVRYLNLLHKHASAIVMAGEAVPTRLALDPGWIGRTMLKHAGSRDPNREWLPFLVFVAKG